MVAPRVRETIGDGIQFAAQPRNRTIEDGETPSRSGGSAKVDRRGYHHGSHGQLRTDLGDFLAAYNFACRLKTPKGLTPYEYICNIWTSEPDRFILDPIRQMPGLTS